MILTLADFLGAVGWMIAAGAVVACLLGYFAARKMGLIGKKK